MNATSSFPFLFDKSSNIQWLFMGILSFFNITIYPFYVYSYNINRERDKKTVVYPLTNLLFEIVQKSFGPFIYCVVFTFVAIIYYSHTDLTKPMIVSEHSTFYAFEALAVFIVYALHVSAQILHFIIFILSVERFFLHFYPSIDISSLPKDTISLIQFLCGLLVLKDIFIIVGYFMKFDIRKMCVFYGSVFIFFNVLILISALLYIPIVIKIRKLKTNRQVFWQTIAIFGFKIISFPILLRLITTEPNVIIAMFFYSLMADILNIPLILQISYLGCNRKTLTALFVNFNLKMFINTVLDRKPSSVEPISQAPVEYTNETTV